MQDQAPELRIAGNVATITLRRPSQHNRIAPDDCTVISNQLSHLAADAAVQVLIITGTGTKTFSSGYTLGAIKDQLDSRFEDMLDCVEQFPRPTICALNGSVYGGATDLALCCDFRLGIRGSKMLMPASRIGLHYYPGGIRRYVRVLGLAAAKKLFLTAQTIDDDEMLRLGFLTERVDAAELDAMVRTYVEHILACEPKVLVTLKADLMSTAYGSADQNILRAHYTESLSSPELSVRLAAINDKKR
ncbi:MAG: enoyl-CoA hydratase/isomerase family protein [Candidimonas sp.]|nr:MAG: enoyl-CoA hydratase/isomerase family protein [Candidimonas sp.]TAM23515.1 MAG: enoyl-CoA hydratase/isomerase family protein [Candidimonas sp.]TAM73946.1 MAG: enoyl-CoA hydratase/isomerase family protein [Candidimonas sp.]